MHLALEEQMTKETAIPLSDGTPCRMSQVAAIILADDFGIERARLKSGAGGNARVVATPKSAEYRNAREVPLIYLLATFAYGFRDCDLEPGQRWVCADGDPRNLTQSNIVPSKSETRCEEPARRAKKERVTVFLDSPAVNRQLDMLGSVIRDRSFYVKDGEEKNAASLYAIGLDILCKPFLVETVLGDVVVTIAEQIRAGQFRGQSDGEFFSWVRTIARNQFKRRQKAAISNAMGDIEPDRAARRLRKTYRAVLAAAEAGLPPIAGTLAQAARIIEKERRDTKRQESAEREAQRQPCKSVRL
jgi:hypothetical protein